MPVTEALLTANKSFNGLIIAGLLLIAPGCISTPVHAQSPEVLTQKQHEQILTKEELYFGLSQPGGGTVSEVQWQLFLNRVITPRFQAGLTVVDANGQYFNDSGELIQEKTKLVILIYENSSKNNQMIAEIIDAYKCMFHQESVLRVTSSVKVSF